MRTLIRKIAILIVLIGVCIEMPSFHNRAFSYAPEVEQMKIKGYSPMMIKMVQDQRNRQEGRDSVSPTLTPAERFFHNIYYNDWTGSIDNFGSEVIRERD
jgi:hypothetical protein